MATEYRPAPAARTIGQRLIKEHHQHLADVRVDYVFRDTATKKGGRVVLGQAKKISGLNAWLAADPDERSAEPDEFFLIELAEDEWVDLSDRQRVALVDHELSHCWFEFDDKTEEPKLSLRAHDLEEFVDVVQRHGLWKEDVQHFVKVGVEQLTLDDA